MSVASDNPLRSHQSTLLARLGSGWRAFAVPGEGQDKAIISMAGVHPVKLRRSTLEGLSRRGYVYAGTTITTRYGAVVEYLLTPVGAEVASWYN